MATKIVPLPGAAASKVEQTVPSGSEESDPFDGILQQIKSIRGMSRWRRNKQTDEYIRVAVELQDLVTPLLGQMKPGCKKSESFPYMAALNALHGAINEHLNKGSTLWDRFTGNQRGLKLSALRDQLERYGNPATRIETGMADVGRLIANSSFLKDLALRGRKHREAKPIGAPKVIKSRSPKSGRWLTLVPARKGVPAVSR